MDAHKQAQYLVGSPSRARLLRILREQPFSPNELVSRTSLSRATIHRNLSTLTKRSWVQQANGQYRITLAGDCILHQYDELLSTIRDVEELGDFSNYFQCLDFDLPSAVIATATITIAEPGNPHAAINRYLNMLDEASIGNFRALTPVVSPVYDKAYRKIIDDSNQLEFIIDESVLNISQSKYPDTLENAYSNTNVDLYIHPDDLTFGLVLLENRVLIAAYDEFGYLRACLDGANKELVEWTTDIYKNYRQTATHIDTFLSLA